MVISILILFTIIYLIALLISTVKIIHTRTILELHFPIVKIKTQKKSI